MKYKNRIRISDKWYTAYFIELEVKYVVKYI